MNPNNLAAAGKNYRKALKARAERAKILLRSRPLERRTTSLLRIEQAICLSLISGWRRNSYSHRNLFELSGSVSPISTINV